MPSPTFDRALAFTRFQAHQIQLPAKAVVAPGGLSLNTAATPALTARPTVGSVKPVKPTVMAAGTPMSTPPALFRAATSSLDDIATQKAMHEGYTRLLDGVTLAVGYAWERFRLEARFKDVVIVALHANAGPGCLVGPSLEPHIKSAPHVAAWAGPWGGVRDAVAKSFAASWQDWQSKITVPGLPWYPQFAAFPGPAAPPTPNVPTPLMACISGGVGSMSAGSLQQGLSTRLAGKINYHEEFSEALASMLAVAFTGWLGSQQVSLVMGRGPVPTFAPPYVPVGPVMNGDIVSAPGHLST